jgi:hypothetical protein
MNVKRVLQEPVVKARMQAVDAKKWSVTPYELGAALREYSDI